MRSAQFVSFAAYTRLPPEREGDTAEVVHVELGSGGQRVRRVEPVQSADPERDAIPAETVERRSETTRDTSPVEPDAEPRDVTETDEQALNRLGRSIRYKIEGSRLSRSKPGAN